jgi:hypothetical protein
MNEPREITGFTNGDASDRCIVHGLILTQLAQQPRQYHTAIL